jgi:selenium-binding protein 1
MGGIVQKAAHPKQPKKPLNGEPKIVEVSRDGRRIYCRIVVYGKTFSINSSSVADINL